MNFLIKIEEAINNLILRLLENLKAMTPHFIFDFYAFLLQLPIMFLKKLKLYVPKLRIIALKFIGYFFHFITIIRGYIITVLMYLRSDEFKKADKTTLILTPVRYSKSHPIIATTYFFVFLAFIGASTLVFENAEKIVSGTLSLRKPASTEVAEEDVYVEFKNHKFEVKINAAGGHGGGHGAPGAEVHEHDLFADVRIEANNPNDKEFLERMDEMLEDNLEAMDISVEQLPLLPENQKVIEELMAKSLNEDFKQIGHDNPIKNIKLKQILSIRPVYYRQPERMFSVSEINLQIFLEDTHRNRQVWMDFSFLTSNRNVVLYLKDHEVQLKDHLTTNVEPVIPQLPIEEEGRLIIKDKIKLELNEFLEKNGIEGKILEVYIDYLMVS